MARRILRSALTFSVAAVSAFCLVMWVTLVVVGVRSFFVVDSVSWHRRSMVYASPNRWVHMLDDSGTVGAAHGTLVLRRDFKRWLVPDYVLDRSLPLPTEPVLKLRRHRRPASDGPAGGLKAVQPKWSCMGVEYATERGVSSHPQELPGTTHQSLLMPSWVPIAAAAPLSVPSVLAGRRLIVRWRRRRRGLCAACGYDLRASGGTCPECGSPAPLPYRILSSEARSRCTEGPPVSVARDS